MSDQTVNYEEFKKFQSETYKFISFLIEGAKKMNALWSETNTDLKALEATICEILPEDQKEIFLKKLEDKKSFYLKMRVEMIQEIDPAWAAKVLGNRNPYEDDQSK